MPKINPATGKLSAKKRSIARSGRRRTSLIFFALLASVVLSAFLASYILNTVGITPRRLAPYLEFRTSGHNIFIERSGIWVASVLRNLDRGQFWPSSLPRPASTPAVAKAFSDRARTVILIDSPDAARKAMETAQPGDTISFLPGVYRFQGANYLEAKQAGRPDQPITIRAEQPGTVQLEFNLVEGFLVTAPYWTFENLTIRGVCNDHSSCEHAFHVVGKASHFIARNNTLLDFNAHLKINGDGKHFPDDGLIEGNIFRNSTIRQTGNPVTLIDLVGASNWLIQGNQLSDFVKGGNDQISYGAFAKGAGEGNRFERNVVVCENRLRNAPGQRVGLSLGGGGTGAAYCRDRRCITEQQGGVIQSNLIASCSDDGIYINRAAGSVVRHNTLIDTGPLVVRFAESSADVEGNLVDSAILNIDNAVLRHADNRQTSIASLYFGLHPVRKLFINTDVLDLAWAGNPPTRQMIEPLPDLCGISRPESPKYGAFENYTNCR